MTKIQFAKMHGCGNDFMVIDAINQELSLTPELIRQWSNRNMGIGFDQLLLVEPSLDATAKFKYRIFNADGTEVEQCGNGARCFAIFVKRQGLTEEDRFWVETKKGLIQLLRHADEQVTVDMGAPQFAPQKIPCNIGSEKVEYELKAFKDILNFSIVSMGNPHCVIFLEDIAAANLNLIAESVTSANLFPEGVNLGIAEIVSPDKIRLRVHERGVGETLACGSGACAAVVAGIRLQRLASIVEVELSGGKMIISWDGIGSTVKMTGPASYVFDGTIYL